LGPSQKTLRSTWCPKLVTGLFIIATVPFVWGLLGQFKQIARSGEKTD